MKTLYISDMDGTLMTPRGNISNKTARMINLLIASGVSFSVATARSAASALPLLKKLRLNTPIVLLNGALIYDPVSEKYLKTYTISEADAEKVIKIFAKYEQTPFLFHLEGECVCVDYTELRLDVHKQFYTERKGMQYKRFEAVEKLSPKGRETVYFTHLMDYETGHRAYEEILASGAANPVFYKDIYSDYWYLEVFSKEAGKPVGMRFVSDYIGADKIVAFGDNLNDLTMLREADKSCAVSNGREEVKKAADLIIGSNRGNAVAKAILKMEKHEKI